MCVCVCTCVQGRSLKRLVSAQMASPYTSLYSPRDARRWCIQVGVGGGAATTVSTAGTRSEDSVAEKEGRGGGLHPTGKAALVHTGGGGETERCQYPWERITWRGRRKEEQPRRGGGQNRGVAPLHPPLLPYLSCCLADSRGATDGEGRGGVAPLGCAAPLG